jgi:hypothetical protein
METVWNIEPNKINIAIKISIIYQLNAIDLLAIFKVLSSF